MQLNSGKISTKITAHLFISAIMLIIGSALAQAQDSPGRVEVGGSLTAVRDFATPTLGVGAEGDFNFGRHFALDSAIDWLPTTSSSANTLVGLFGAKAGIRKERFGYFLKVRPGFVTSSNVFRSSTTIVTDNTVSGFSTHNARLTQPTLDLGGVIEYYPASHWALRWDVGDMLIFQETLFTNIEVLNGQTSVQSFPGKTTNNFRFSTSLHYRF